MSLTTVANVSEYLQQTIDGTTTPTSTTVQTWIDEVSDEIEHITKAKFEVNTVTEQILAINSDTTRTSGNAIDSKGDYQPIPRDEIILPNTNIIGLISVEINTVSDSEEPVWSALTIGYGGDVILVGNRISILKSGFAIRVQKAGIRVTYTYGSSTVPGFVQKIATRMVVLDHLNSSVASDASGGGGDIRVGDIEIQEPGRFTQDYVDSVQGWVDKKLRQLGTHNVYLI